MKTYLLTLLALAVCLTSCATVPNEAENANADHGPYPGDYEALVHTWIAKAFFDPHSIQDLHIEKPVKGWKTGAPILGEPSVTYGWEVLVDVNGKNRLGGYTGLQRYDLLIRNGAIVYEGNLTYPGL